MTEQGPGLFCTFRLADQHFGVAVRHVKEVNAGAALTPIPHAPPEVRGYVNLRGQIHLVLDLRVPLGLRPAAIAPDSRLILFKPAVGDACGILVDGLGDIVSLTAAQIESLSPDEASAEGLARGASFLVGLGKLPDELLILLDPGRLLAEISGQWTVVSGQFGE